MAAAPNDAGHDNGHASTAPAPAPVNAPDNVSEGASRTNPDGEIEVMPGVFLIPRRAAAAQRENGGAPHATDAGHSGDAAAAQRRGQRDAAIHVRQRASGDLCGSVEWLEAEIQRTVVSLDHLVRSNAEMSEFLAANDDKDDPVLRQAIEENHGVMARQRARLERLRAVLLEAREERLGPMGAAVLNGTVTIATTFASSSPTNGVAAETQGHGVGNPLQPPLSGRADTDPSQADATDLQGGLYL